MSVAAPRSCLKPPPRNPWVAEDGGESSASSTQQQQQQQPNHQQQNNQSSQQQQQQQEAAAAAAAADVLAHQYATPYQAAAALAGTGTAHSVTGQPTVGAARAAQQQQQHGVVHSHTAHSLHAHAHAHARPLPANAAHSVHSVPGSLQQPWMEPQLLWSTPALPGMGGGVFTVGGGEAACGAALPTGIYSQTHTLHPLHALPPPAGGGSSGQASTTGGGWSHPQAGGVGWVAGAGVRASGGSGVEGSRCELCHYYCFRAAQAAFVAGIVTGFSLLVAGGVFHRQHVAHLQVLVYIGALVSLVCVVLLVIFCAMNKDHRTSRRGGGGGGAALRFSGPQVVVGDPEAMPLRPLDSAPPVVVPSEASHGGRTAESGSSSLDILHHSNHSHSHSSCLAGPPTTHSCLGAAGGQPVCYGGGAVGVAGVGTMNHSQHVAGNSSEVNQHIQQQQHQARQRAEEDYEASQRYNRIWRQPNISSEAASKL